MKPQHQAIAAGLALTLAFGSAAAPSTIYANTESDTEGAQAADGTSDGSAADAGDDTATGDDAAEALPEPSGYDRTADHEVDPAIEAEIEGMPSIMMLSVNSLMASRAMSITPTSLSSEMKYFAENESGSNYDQGFSYYDGYNAMGFYQFDRHYSLLDFMEACYAYNPDTYAMFAPVIERGDELMSGEIYDSDIKGLTEIGRLAEDAWHAAYAANPSEFSALQDNFAYQEYYLPVERILRKKGVDISGRADCVKGLAWGLCNLFGTSGCQKFFDDAELSDDMTDRQFVNALCDAVVEGVYTYDYGYADSYASRYERERATCLEYIAEDEREAGQTQPDQGEEAPDTEGDEVPGEGSGSDVEAPGSDDAEGDAAGDEAAGDDAAGDDTAGDEAPAPSDEGDGSAGSDAGEGADDDAVVDDAEDESGDDPANGPADGDAPAGDEGDDAPDQDQDADQSQDVEDDAAEVERPVEDVEVSEDSADEDDGAVKPAPLPPANSTVTGDSSTDDATDDGASDESVEDGGATSDESAKDDDKDGGDATDDRESDEADDEAGDDAASEAEDAGATKSQTEDDGAAKAEGDSDKARAAAEPAVEKLPATADAATVGLVVSAGLSAIGGGAIVAGGKVRRSRDPFEDGFRE